VKQRVSVQVSDPAQRRWGFELTARLASNPSNGQAGDLSPADGYTQVRCDNGRPKPCSAASPVQFITHTLSGTRPGTTGGVSFDFDWTPPASDSGDIVLYAAANAANANNNDTGDHIYTSSLRLTPAAVSAKPAIGAAGVVNAASFQPGIAPSSWLTITGSNLASTTRAWNSDDLAAGNLPLSLDGVSVTINGKPAYVEYVSPSQINVVTPSDAAAGTVEVKVTASGQTSDPAYAELQAFAPAFFSFDGKYLAATHADNTLLGKPGLFPSAPNLTTPAKPGETVILYGTGFGPTSPSIADGRLTDQIASITARLTITIGGVPPASHLPDSCRPSRPSINSTSWCRKPSPTAIRPFLLRSAA
jgi:IPT/TIG domain.